MAGEDDDDLHESLARARRAAEKQQKGLLDPFAEQLASRREQDEAQQAMDTDKAPGTACSATFHCVRTSNFQMVLSQKPF